MPVMNPSMNASSMESVERWSRNGVAGLLKDRAILVKPVLTAMVIFTAASGYVLGAGGARNLTHLLETLLAIGLSAAGSAALNMFLERDVDAIMTRTRSRPIPSGRVSQRDALVFGGAILSAGLFLSVFLLGRVAALTVFAASAIYLILYVPLKRRSRLQTFLGAVAGALPPVAGYIEASGRIDAGAAAVFVLLYLWQIPHFLAVAWERREDFRLAGIMTLSTGDEDGRRTVRLILFFTILLLPASLWLWWLRLSGGGYAVLAVVLSAFLFASGLPMSGRTSGHAIHSYYRVSLGYLPILMGSLIWFLS